MTADRETTAPTAQRRRWMSVLARADVTALEAEAEALGPADYTWLRRPEVGAVMVRGRMGGDGRPFNVGEMTVTRCTLRLGDGTAGTAYVPGRAPRKAELAALFDAALQEGGETAERLSAFVNRLERQQREEHARRSRKAAATRVDFFTMVRGENK